MNDGLLVESPAVPPVCHLAPALCRACDPSLHLKLSTAAAEQPQAHTHLKQLHRRAAAAAAAAATGSMRGQLLHAGPAAAPAARQQRPAVARPPLPLALLAASQQLGRTQLVPRVTARQHVQPPEQELLPFPADTMPDSRQQLVADVLGLTPADATLLLLSSPAAATLPAPQLAASWAALQQLLPVPVPQLLQAALQLPELLERPAAVVAHRLQQGADVLGLPACQLRSRQAGSTALLHWQLLLMPQQQLAAAAGQLGQQLRLQRAQVAALLCAEPRLLALSQVQLVSSVEALEQVCGVSVSRLQAQLLREPRLLVTPAEQLYDAAAALQQQLRLSEDGLALALRRAPAALCVPAESIGGLLDTLAQGLEIGRDVAADILLQEPEVLLRGPGAVAAVLGVLRSTFRLGTDALLQVVQFDPHVLCASPGELAESTRKFRQLATSDKAWGSEFRQLMSRPVNVARALRIEPLRLARLAFLQEQHQAAALSLKAALTMSGRQFVAAFPRYAPWLAARYSGGGGVPAGYRAGQPVRHGGSSWGTGRGNDSDGGSSGARQRRPFVRTH